MRNSNAWSVYLLFLSGIDKVEKNVVVLGGAFFCWKCVVPWSWISLELPVILLHCKINLIRVHQKCFKNSSVRWSWNGLGMSSALLQPAGVRSSDASIL